MPGKPTNEEVENAAKGIWSIVAFPDWQTWEGRIELERAHRGDGSYGDMTGTCRKYARVALEMARSAEGVADTVKEGNNDE